MSRLFEALQHSELETQQPSDRAPFIMESGDLSPQTQPARPELEQARSVPISVSAESDLPFLSDRMAIASEKFRLLAFRLRQAQERSGFKKLLVTSAAVQDGKSLISANLAGTLAAWEKQRVLLIEGDLRQPRLGHIFGMQDFVGLSDWMDHQSQPFTKFSYRLGDLSLWLMPAGTGKASALEILNSERLRNLMEELASQFDYIVIDSPPLLPLADTHLWETLADATLLVVREGKTPKKMLQQALENLDRAKLIGAVLNEATLGHNKYYQYYGQSGQPMNPTTGPEEGKE